MDFLSWHYSEGVKFYAERLIYSLKSIIHYFSLSVLLTSLFAPWKRLVNIEKKTGFDLSRAFQTFSFNMVSRGIGAVVRIILFITGVFVLVFVAVFGSIGAVFWVVFPFFSLGVYTRYRNNPEFIAGGIWEKMKNGNPALELFKSKPGQFLISHIGVSSERLIQKYKAPKLAGKPKSFEEIIVILLKGEAWSSVSLREENITKEDMLLTARWWDKKHSSNSLDINRLEFDYGGIGRDLLFGYTPLLSQYGSDMSVSKFSHHLIGRGDVVSRIERNLTGGKSVIITGEPGVGKKTVVYEFALKARRGKFGPELAYRRVLELDYNFVFSASVDKNRKKQQLSDIFEEASGAGNIILVLRDLHRMTSSDIDITDVLETHLEKGKLKIISISTNEDFEKYLARASKLRKYFERVEVKEPTMEEAKDILLEAADTWEKQENIVITVPALRRILEGSEQYITDTPFPEKALELLDAVVFLEEQKGADKIITVDDVNAVLFEKTGVSVANLSKDESARLANLEEIIHERLVNQEEAVNLIAKILRSKSLVASSKRPVGSFLFLGPTGVGKTETAKVLAKVYFGTTDKVLRFDMAEYVGREGLERLIGSVEKNLPGTLTTGIKNNQASLLLLDEFEKAPPEVFNIFLALLDEGSITDAFGKKINCRNLFVLATSNAGAEYVRELVEKSEANLQEKVMDHVLRQNIFSPELLNRFDGVVVYKPLDFDHLVKIAQILLRELSANLEKKNITLNFSDEAVKKLAKDGYEPQFGARPMRRIIELSIGDLLGKAILSEQVKPGNTVTITPGEGKGEFLLGKPGT